MQRLTLIRHGSTSAVRSAAFPLDEPLDESGREAAGALAGLVARSGEAWSSPSRRAQQTAELLGLAPTLDPALDECDFGRWRGRTLADLHEEDPAGVGAWMTDPAAAPHGGESLEQLVARVRGWLDARAAVDGRTVAVTSGGVIRAAVVIALGAGVDATWRVDVTPLHATVLH
ncbi:MAG: histidine phosphatase family protein, partial [Patulibacter sp.]